MPHCQKENHNHAAKSKKDRLKAKQETAARRQRLKEERAAAEAEAALKLSNNIAPLEGHGQYEVGYEPEPEYTRFNVKKRSKKHLRNDLRKRMLREAQEEEERLRKQQEEEYRKQKKQQQQQEEESSSSSDDEEASPVLEYFVFICECCDKRYATKNQFLNHTNSKKHKSKVRIYEELGLLVTHVELRGENGNEHEIYDDDEEDNENWQPSETGEAGTQNNNPNTDTTRNEAFEDETSDDDDDDDDDDDYVPSNRKNIFAGFAQVGFSSSSEDESSEEEDTQEDRKPAPVVHVEEASEDEEEKDDGIDFEELIHQNRLLQEQINAEEASKANATETLPPVPFHETYDPDDYDVNENRLVSVQHRLRKNLAAKGIAPASKSHQAYDPFDAITMGKTLLQEVLEANIDTLQQKLDAYKKHKENCELMAKEFAFAKGNSKALPAQYIHKQDAADNARRRANVHHAGSHYHMQAARTMQFGRRKGMMARHSNQGARLQASRMAAKMENARVTSKGAMKAGKVSSKKKSTQKSKGEAGGSKKSGGAKGGD